VSRRAADAPVLEKGAAADSGRDAPVLPSHRPAHVVLQVDHP